VLGAKELEMAIDLPNDYESPDGLLLANFADQFAQKGIDPDRANALAEILARESADPSLIDGRSTADKELIAGVVDDMSNPDGAYLAKDLGINKLTFDDRVKPEFVDQFEQGIYERADATPRTRNGRRRSF
jgi:hypothetical protein